MMTMLEAARALHAPLIGEDALFTGVSIDSRSIKRGDLFVALKGPTFDGHDFIAQVRDKGSVGVLVDQDYGAKVTEGQISLIPVPDTRAALGQLAAHWRGHFNIPIVAVTGSNGKTSVKEMVALVLRHALGQGRQSDDCDRVLATEGNLNNDIGVPLMLLRLRESHCYAVIEMGMNHSGEIAYLTRLTRPHVAVITNAGQAHVGEVGSLDAVARAKGEIFEGLDPEGTAIINADDSYAPLWRGLAGDREVMDFALQSKACVTARYSRDLLAGGLELVLPGGVEKLALQVPGEHNVRNALAAAAAATSMGIGTLVIATGLNAFGGVKGRMQQKRGLRGATLIDDSYNANPDSVRAALAVLAKAEGEKILVLGDMGELGERARDFHERVGEEARSAGIDRLMAVGEFSAYTAEKFGEGARHFKKIEELIAEIENLVKPGATLLIKGSRFMQMERVVKHLEFV
jgi:UDP-N-acetylmuramoyl-tripeptide--D-alanyl-D-alanine ligase